LVDELVHLDDRIPRYDPERDGLAAAAVLFPRVHLGELSIRRRDRARVRERLPLPLLAEHLPDRNHAASASSTSRTQAELSRAVRRRSSRSSVFGPWPVTTCLSSSQSGSVYSQTPSSFLRSFGSGTSRPSSQICGA